MNIFNNDLNLSYLEMHIVDHCNLNCNLCSHFANYASPDYLKINSFEEQIIKMKEFFHQIECLAILGGEPLLHPDLISFLVKAREHLPKAEIQLATNAILMKNYNEDFWNVLKQLRILLRITIYPNTKVDKEMLISRGTEYNIAMRINSINNSNWYDLVNYKGNSDKKLAFNNCPSKICHTLYHGKFYLCPRPAYINILNAKNLINAVVNEDDYVDIFSNNAKNKLKKYMKHIKKNEPLEFCRWCVEKRVPIQWEGRKRSE